MKRLLTLLLIALWGSAFGQQIITQDVEYTNRWSASNILNIPYGGVVPSTRLNPGSLRFYPSPGKLAYWDTTWQYLLSETNAESLYYNRTQVNALIAAIPLFDASLYYTKIESDALYPTLTGGGANGTWNINVLGNASTVTNGVYSTSGYVNPPWITSLAYSKITGAPSLSLTTTGSSGAATLVDNTLNIPQYSGGITTMSAIGSIPNANGASISGDTLTLQPASDIFGGVVTTGNQTFMGDKEFKGNNFTVSLKDEWDPNNKFYNDLFQSSQGYTQYFYSRDAFDVNNDNNTTIDANQHMVLFSNRDSGSEPHSRSIRIDATKVELRADNARFSLIDNSAVLQNADLTVVNLSGTGNRFVSASPTGVLSAVDNPTTLAGYGITDAASSSDLTGYQLLSEKGANNGYAPLDAGGKIPFSNLPSSLMIYKGVWVPNTNTPTLSDGTGVAGWVYRANTAGSADLGSGIINFLAGDYVIHNGTAWERSVGTNNVVSVNGQQGIVSLSTANIPEGTNLYYTEARVNANGNLLHTMGNETKNGNLTINGEFLQTRTGKQVVIDAGEVVTNDLTTSASAVLKGTGSISLGVTTPHSGDISPPSGGFTAVRTQRMQDASGDIALTSNFATGQTIGANTTGNAASSTNSTQLNGYTFDSSISPSGTIDFLMGRKSGMGELSLVTPTMLRVFQGSPSGGEDLESILSRGNTATIGATFGGKVDAPKVTADTLQFTSTRPLYVGSLPGGSTSAGAGKNFRFSQSGSGNALTIDVQDSSVWASILSFRTSGITTKQVSATNYVLSGALNTAPASATAPGTIGDIRYTSDYIYVCIANSTWVRAPLSTW